MSNTNNDAYVRARINKETKKLATNALKSMGLSTSDAIRLLMIRIANENCLPFEIKVPNANTQKAMIELQEGKGAKMNTIDELMKDLHDENN
jgi:DNA-damage-inducible protein J